MFCSIRLCWSLVLLQQAIGLKSYRSHVTENGKPILRTGNDNDMSEQNNENTDPEWLAELRANISQLVNDHGYEESKPRIQQLVEETEKKMNVLLHVKVGRDGTTMIELGPSEPSFRASKNKKDVRTNMDPLWLTQFKGFVKALVQSYGLDKSKEMLKHMIKTLEKKYHVKIEDVDVNQFGDVFVKYLSKKKTNKKKKIKRVKGSWSNET
nr:uncharacterized protein LOC116774702 isoform X1 [Danaus plexippus plexippus]